MEESQRLTGVVADRIPKTYNGIEGSHTLCFIVHPPWDLQLASLDALLGILLSLAEVVLPLG